MIEIKNNKVYVILGSIVSLSLLISVLYYYLNIVPNQELIKQYSNLSLTEAEELINKFDEDKEDIFGYRLEGIMNNIDNGEVVALTAENIYDIMHQMANTLIIAEDIWGYIRITPDRLNYLNYC